MAEKPTISLRYQLQLDEFQEAFRIASFGQKGIMAWTLPALFIDVKSDKDDQAEFW